MGQVGGGAQNSQVINGQTYIQYTPAWYAAMQAETQRQAAAQGTAAGTTVKAANDAAGLPSLSGAPASSGSSSGSVTTSSTPYTPQPQVTSPSLAGLTAAASAAAPTSGGSNNGSGSTGYAHLAPVDTSAAEAASFNKAKDAVGQTTSGALTGLRSALASRGMLGSGLEERGTASAINAGAGQLGDVSRQQAVTRADEAQKNAETNFQGGITQRGQDLSKATADNSLAGSLAIAGQQGAITQRGQDISDRNAQKALELESAQLASQQRSTALAGLEAALKVTSPSGMMY